MEGVWGFAREWSALRLREMYGIMWGVRRSRDGRTERPASTAFKYMCLFVSWGFIFDFRGLCIPAGGTGCRWLAIYT